MKRAVESEFAVGVRSKVWKQRIQRWGRMLLWAIGGEGQSGHRRQRYERVAKARLVRCSLSLSLSSYRGLFSCATEVHNIHANSS